MGVLAFGCWPGAARCSGLQPLRSQCGAAGARAASAATSPPVTATTAGNETAAMIQQYTNSDLDNATVKSRTKC